MWLAAGWDTDEHIDHNDRRSGAMPRRPQALRCLGVAIRKVQEAACRRGRRFRDMRSHQRTSAGHLLRRPTKGVSRVLKPGGSATFLNGLAIRGQLERELPRNQRYLPMAADGTLGKRIRTETLSEVRESEKSKCGGVAFSNWAEYEWSQGVSG